MLTQIDFHPFNSMTSINEMMYEYVMKKNVLEAVEHLPTVDQWIKPRTPIWLFKTYHGIDKLLHAGVLDPDGIAVPARPTAEVGGYTFSVVNPAKTIVQITETFSNNPKVTLDTSELFRTYLLIVPRYPVQHPWHGVYVGWGIVWEGKMLSYHNINQGTVAKYLRDTEGNTHMITPSADQVLNRIVTTQARAGLTFEAL